MKRIGSILVAVAILGSVLLSPSTASADVQNFYFSDFQADYYLSKDSENRSVLRVVEQLTAVFPDFDQNRGIERAIPAVYDGHSVSFKLDSLTRNGQPEPVYSQEIKNNNVVIGTGTEEYVRGKQVYQLTYTLRDVTKNFGDHQEFYWDTNGTGWGQSFDHVTARVHLDAAIEGAFAGEVACYEGEQGQNRSCLVDKVDGRDSTFTANGRLGSHENVTAVLKFNAATFASRPWSILDMLIYVPLVISSIAITLALYVWIKYGRNAQGKGTIIPEYIPPKDMSVLLASELCGASSKGVTAQIIDFAVRHKIRLIETEKSGLFGMSSEYTVELLDVSGLDDIELEVMTDIFTSHETGQTYTFKKTDRVVGQSLHRTQTTTTKIAISQGYREANKLIMKLLGAGISVVIVALTIMFFTASDTVGIISGVSTVVGLIAIFVMVIATAHMLPLTEKGREVYDYLKGLEMYIKLAEVDRLRVLQSPAGAEKTPVNTDDTAQIVKLYERVLPYAVLFGLEKEWANELAIQYSQTSSQPDWYSGSGAFNAAIFASSIGSFTSTATNFSAPSNSGSSGFGGGFSGGGGGGGGGGGR